MNTTTKRFQLDLTEQEHAEMERLMMRAGIKTKREFIGNTLTLFKWAANELANGRFVASADAAGGSVRQLEMPALQPFALLGHELNKRSPSPEELHRRSQQTGISPEVFFDQMRELLEKVHAATPVLPRSGSVPTTRETV